MTFKRYAIYYVPDTDAEWGRFATRWLGWDMVAHRPVPHPDIKGLDIQAITETPRKYGLHATLKPPMRLADGYSVNALQDACTDLARTLPPVTIERLQLLRLGRFLALGADGDISDLQKLAAACVTRLDQFRAAPTEAELAHRLNPGLSPAHQANLCRWGYPHVLDQFRFHITLTGKLPKPLLPQIETVLTTLLVPLLPAPCLISNIALTGEAADGQFHLIKRFALTG